ncbi:beta-defensin-like 2 [Pangasianodon hypophthalmus]|uniref:beta-defensin-like 2 n=1 Tax=Pangasianodon hypophthalmus TaxID=310915 RepID=UPI00147A493C|nr:beta-defensin-like 2 [Pangasianodon hypophthalmus]
MRRLDLILFLFLLVISAGHTHKAESHNRMCGYRGLCRRVCFTREYNSGHHGCPHRYRCCAVRS